jgi:hypothetical protein
MIAFDLRNEILKVATDYGAQKRLSVSNFNSARMFYKKIWCRQ